MRAQTTGPAPSARALGLRAQLHAAATNDLGEYLSRIDCRVVKQVAKAPGAPAKPKMTKAEKWAATDDRILAALRRMGEASVKDIAAKTQHHTTCICHHVNVLVDQGRVTRRTIVCRQHISLYSLAARANPEHP